MVDNDDFPTSGSFSQDLEAAIPLLQGENIILRLNNVSLLLRTSESQTALGVLFITNYQILHVSKTALPCSTYVQNNFIISVCAKPFQSTKIQLYIPQIQPSFIAYFFKKIGTSDDN